MQDSRTLTYTLILFLIGFIFFSLISCSKREIKPVSEESKIAQEAFEVLEKLRIAYLENDHRELENSTIKAYYMEVLGGIKNFDDAKLFFIPTWVEIEDSTVYVTVSWKGTWRQKDNVVDQRGISVFEFEGRPLKLAKIHRDNPFRQPE